MRKSNIQRGGVSGMLRVFVLGILFAFVSTACADEKENPEQKPEEKIAAKTNTTKESRSVNEQVFQYIRDARHARAVGEFDEAIKSYKMALGVRSDDHRIYLEMARLYAWLGNRVAAERAGYNARLTLIERERAGRVQRLQRRIKVIDSEKKHLEGVISRLQQEQSDAKALRR